MKIDWINLLKEEFSMAGSMSDYLEAKVLDHTLGTTAYTKPASVYCALFTTAPTDAGGGTEVSGGAYARQAATFSAATVGAGSTSNSADITFPVATAAWNTINAVALFDASTAGNILWWGTLSTAKTINTNDQFKIAAGNLTITLD
jgi:hypothetical protein